MRVTLTTLAMLLSLSLAAAAADQDDKLTPERRRELEKKALELNKEGEKQYERGNFTKAMELCRRALDMRRALYPKKEFPNGHADLAESIHNVAFLHQTAGKYRTAEPLFQEVLDMYRALFPRDKYPNGHDKLAMEMNSLAELYRLAGEYGKAEQLHREALEMNRGLYPKKDFPDGHFNLAISMNNLALLYHYSGEYGKAEPLFRSTLHMRRALFPKKDFPNGHSHLAVSINNLALLYDNAGDYRKAEPLYREAVAMFRALYTKKDFPNGHPELAAGIMNLAGLYWATGEYGKAEPHYHEALDVYRACFPKKEFPNGHPELATIIMNLATLHHIAWEYAKAESLYRESLNIYRGLFPRRDFPKGHPELALTINNLACLYAETGEYGKAEPLSREALNMYRALYPKQAFPNGHPKFARSINNRACLYQDLGEYGRAEPLYHEALDMYRALFPNKLFPYGHPHLAESIDNLATLHRYAGEHGKARPLSREAVTMYQRLLLNYADLAAEAESRNYLATQPLASDAFLSVSRHLPDSPSDYETLWQSRAALTRLEERRHRDFMASRDRQTAALADQLRLTRLSLAGMLMKPGRDAEAHHKKIEQLTETKEDLEKRIAAKLKLAPLQPTTASPTPKQLRAALPAGAAFVDLYRYTYFEQDPKVKGKKGEKRTPSYVAFIVRKDKPAIRVELKAAKPIDDAWAAWHNAITADRPDEKAERDAAKKLADLVWEPIRKHLPDKVKTVYLAPDGKLSQVPWAALPGKKADTILLDEHAICLVLHGPWLLERLEEKAASSTGSTLVAYGGVDYDRGPAAALKPRDDVRGPALSQKRRIKWSDLPGTSKEQAAIVALARKVLKDKPIARSGRDTNTKQLEKDLPKARYAHIATHGFFADPEFRSALQVDPKLFEYRGFGERRGGARSPLVLSGLVLAGANRQGEDAAPDHGIITAEGLIGLRMEGLELAVLSACETGLGESGGGEGVYGLQRAFHIAGCKNAIASLWKVDDAATQALMTLFYRNLWEKKLDAADALRQAQLTLYRNPAAAEVVKKRGADFTESDLPEVKPDAQRKHAPTAHWAAFTFSGVRQPKTTPGD
jgi:CHAT domain-containing protein